MNKVKQTRVPFSQTPNKLLNSTEISLTAKGLYAFMQGKAENWNFTIASMQKQLKEGQRAIRSALTELKEYGWLSYEKHNDGSGTYTVNLKPVIESPNVQNVDVDNANIAKRTQGDISVVSEDDPNVQNPHVQNAKMAKRTRINKKDSIERKITNKKDITADVKTPADSTLVFNEYVLGMKQRYGENVKPARNAKINKLLNVMIERIGLEQSLQVARNYPLHQNNWYVQKVHAVEFMVQDCEALSIQVQSGQMITRKHAFEQDKQGAFQNNIQQMQLDPQGQVEF